MTASAEPDRSAAIRQVTAGGTMAERSNAAFDQITPVTANARGKVDQIDSGASPVSDGEIGAPAPDAPSGCALTPEQQAIVTSLEAQGRLPAGDCEMVAWFGQPSDNADDRALRDAVLAGAPELAGIESETARMARLEEERLKAEEAAARATASTFLLPAVPGE